MFYCFHKANGQLIWSFLADAPIEVYPRVSDGMVYFGTLNRTCYALDASTGKQKWSFQGGGSIVLELSFYRSYVMFKSIGALLILEGPVRSCKDDNNDDGVRFLQCLLGC